VSPLVDAVADVARQTERLADQDIAIGVVLFVRGNRGSVGGEPNFRLTGSMTTP
jgi:hypothetical protein